MANEKKGLVDITSGAEVEDADKRYSLLDASNDVYGAMYLAGNTTFTTITDNTFTKVAGTTVAGELNNITMSLSNRLLISSSLVGTRRAAIHVHISPELDNQNDRACAVTIFKNNAQIANLISHFTPKKNDDDKYRNASLSVIVEIEADDYFEVFVRNEEDTDNIKVEDMQVVLHSI